MKPNAKQKKTNSVLKFPKKLKEYNVDEASIDWNQSILGERKQCVNIESKTSELLYCENKLAIVTDEDII